LLQIRHNQANDGFFDHAFLIEISDKIGVDKNGLIRTE